MTTTHILVALDGSPSGNAILPYVQAIATKTSSALRLLSVVTPEPRGLTPRSEQVADDLEATHRATLTRYLEREQQRLAGAGFAVEHAVVLGDPVETILDAADRPEVTAVALSTHSRHGIERWAMGSVADKVIRLNPHPTLVVRPPYFPVPRRDVTLHRLLVPLDGTPLPECAVAAALELVPRDGTVFLVRVVPWRTDGVAPPGTVPEFDLMEEAAQHDAEAYLADAVKRLAPHAPVETRVLRGRPAESLVDFAWHDHIDLMVMTTHARRGLRRWVLGSTADAIVRAGVPALLLRPDGRGCRV